MEIEPTSEHSKKNAWFLIFLVSPVISLYIALKNYRANYAKNVVWLFAAFFGYTFIIDPDSDFDILRYKQEFDNYYIFGGSYYAFFAEIFSGETSNADILVPFIGFTVFNNFGNYTVYLVVLGLIYGYFYSRNIWYIIERVNGNLITNTILYITVFSFLFPIWRGLNGPRFSIGAHIYFFGMCKYILENKKYGLLIASLSVLSHFSIAIAVVITWIYVAFGNKMHIYFILYAITLFIKEINISGFSDLAENLPTVFSKRLNDYGNEDYAKSVIEAAETINWYAQYSVIMLRWTASGIVLLMYFNARDYFKENKLQADFYSFILLFLSFANIMSLVASGDRFLTFAYLFVFAIYAWFTNNFITSKTIFFAFNKFAQYALMLFFIVEIRIGFDFMGFITILGNPIVASIFENDKALITLFK